MDDLIVPAPPGPAGPATPPSGDADQNLVAQKLNIIENALNNMQKQNSITACS